MSNKEIIEKLARLEEGQKGLNKRIDDLRSELKGDIAGLRSLVYVVLAGIIALNMNLLMITEYFPKS